MSEESKKTEYSPDLNTDQATDQSTQSASKPLRKKHKGEGHRKRLREKFMASESLDSFSDYEIIELLLTLGQPRRDCKDQAKAAIKAFKNIRGVLEASSEDLKKVHGIGPANVFGIKFIKAVADYYLFKRIENTAVTLNNSKELHDFLLHTIRDKSRERFVTIFLNAKNRVIATKTMFEGTLTSSAVYPREVVAEAIRQEAAALIFAHNHPSGDPAPSPEDMALTRKLVSACHLVGITVHEHIVIGDNTYFSFADNGHIARMRREQEVRDSEGI